MHENFGISVASKCVAKVFQLDSQLAEVVNRTIENDTNRGVRRQHWLASRFTQVKDCEAAMSKHSTTPNFQPFAIGPPADQSRHHLTNAALCFVAIA
jgi:hypothetical protein